MFLHSSRTLTSKMFWNSYIMYIYKFVNVYVCFHIYIYLEVKGQPQLSLILRYHPFGV